METSSFLELNKNESCNVVKLSSVKGVFGKRIKQIFSVFSGFVSRLRNVNVCFVCGDRELLFTLLSHTHTYTILFALDIHDYGKNDSRLCHARFRTRASTACGIIYN